MRGIRSDGMPIWANGNQLHESAWLTFLEGVKTQTLRSSALGGAPAKEVQIEANGIDRVDVLINSGPVLSQDVKPGIIEVSLLTAIVAGSTATGGRV